MLFVTGRRKRAIEDHFDAEPELGTDPLIDPRTGLQILYTRQARPAGLGDALRYARGLRAAARRSWSRSATRSSSTPPAAAPGIVPRLIEAYEDERGERGDRRRGGADAARARATGSLVRGRRGR